MPDKMMVDVDMKMIVRHTSLSYMYVLGTIMAVSQHQLTTDSNCVTLTANDLPIQVNSYHRMWLAKLYW